MEGQQVIHLVEPGARTYLGHFLARCGFMVDHVDERRQREQQIPVDCPTCLALEAEDDAALAALKEKPHAAA
jgi:hypothetical protein